MEKISIYDFVNIDRAIDILQRLKEKGHTCLHVQEEIVAGPVTGEQYQVYFFVPEYVPMYRGKE